MSESFPSDADAALTPCEIVALAEEMNTAGFPEIAEVLIGLAYELADRTADCEPAPRIVERDRPADQQSSRLQG